jgi:hypothetical protein
MKSSLFKLILRGLILGGGVLAFACVANAATFLNTYGTGEEFNLWQNAGPVILTELGCSSTATFFTTDGNSGVAVGTGCPAAISKDNGVSDGFIYFSFTDLASWDGIDAVNNFYDEDNWGTYHGPFSDPVLNTSTTGDPTVVNPCATKTSPNANQRLVATCAQPGCTTGLVTTNSAKLGYACQAIHIGVSNLEASSLVQETIGTLQGPIDGQDAGTGYTRRKFPKTGVSTSHLPKTVSVTVNGTLNSRYPNPSSPIVYPYGFYVNPGVTATTCSSEASNAALVGSYCLADTDCGSTSPSGTCTSQTINNLTRLQVVALFSGAIKNWSDFGGYYANNILPVTLCLRHSGAGTLAVLDLGVMQGSDGKGWGANLVTEENRVASGEPPYIYFNNTQGDEKNCLTWANGGTLSTSTNPDTGHTNVPDTLPSDVKGGAVGFLDADNGNTANYVQVKYNGTFGTRVTMRDGIFDDFWIMDRLYAAPGLLAGQLAVYGQMLTFASKPDNFTNANLGGSRGSYYGSSTELNFPKANAGVYPYLYKGGGLP